MKTKIYFLRDENRVVKYVGMTIRPLKERLREHISEAMHGGKHHRCNGIRKMLHEGKMPTIILQTEVNNGPAAEIAYIKWFRSKGVELWNETDGGEGVAGLKWSEESKRKQSILHTGVHFTEETKRKMRNRRHTQATRRQMSLAHKGKSLTATHAKNISLAKAGKCSPLALAALAKGHLSWKGRHHTLEWRKRISLLQTGKKRGPHSIEARIKMSLSQRKRPPPSQETKKKISISITKVWEKRKQPETYAAVS